MQRSRVSHERSSSRYGCDLVVLRMANRVTRFIIKVRSTGRGNDLIKSFFHRYDGLLPEVGACFPPVATTFFPVTSRAISHSVGRAIAEAVAREGADVVIWLRRCNDEVNEEKVLPITLLETPSQLPNGGAPTSLWRQTMAQKSYW